MPLNIPAPSVLTLICLNATEMNYLGLVDAAVECMVLKHKVHRLNPLALNKSDKFQNRSANE